MFWSHVVSAKNFRFSFRLWRLCIDEQPIEKAKRLVLCHCVALHFLRTRAFPVPAFPWLSADPSPEGSWVPGQREPLGLHLDRVLKSIAVLTREQGDC